MNYANNLLSPNFGKHKKVLNSKKKNLVCTNKETNKIPETQGKIKKII